MDLINLPKVELHIHLDCSLSYDVVRKLDSKITYKKFLKDFIGSNCNSLKDYINCADRAVKIMQNKYQLELVIEDLFDQLKKDNVIYVEIRFAPLLHTSKGLSSYEVVEIISKKVQKESVKNDIYAGLILCTLRHYTKEESLETIQLVKKFSKTNVVGFDIAADEAGFPLDNHTDAFNFARKNNIPATAHAGEAKGPESVAETIDKLNPKRIGHGVRSVENIEVLNDIKKQNIHLEICPSSNIATRVYKNFKSHPIDKLYKSGLSISINSDGRTISNTNLNKEYLLLSKNFNWKKKHFLKCNLNAIDASFASKKIKKELILRLKNESVNS